MSIDDPYPKPSFSLANRVRRQIWSLVWLGLGKYSPRFAHAWRVFLLRVFGAKIGSGCAIYPRTTIWAPWNLECEDVVAVAEGAEIYNPARVVLRSHSIISQGAYLCGATHDFRDHRFPLVAGEIEVGAYAWICARATVLLDVVVGEGAVLGLGSVATRSLEPWSVYCGLPAKRVGSREVVSHD